ncbi:MAG: hypothetical protein IH851_09855 [Armatimonadetes bacterium]|nr:hypothetical protein [Armatimonadota bacterium]
MKDWVRSAVFVVGGLALAVTPLAKADAEAGLGGIKLYDSGMDVVKKFGSPSDIEAITFGRQSGGGGGARPGGSGFARPPGGSGPTGAVAFVAPPLSLRAASPQRPTPTVSGAGPSPGGGGGGGSAAGGGTAGATESQYVRWIYQRGAGSSFNFVLNKHNKVVQIEALGIVNRQAKTNQGITLGSTLAQVIEKYEDPDGYDIGTDYFMVRFLQRFNVAFQFTREHSRAPYRVTSIVVSAGSRQP